MKNLNVKSGNICCLSCLRDADTCSVIVHYNTFCMSYRFNNNYKKVK